MDLHKTDSTSLFLEHFSDPEAIKNYADGIQRFVPGRDALHRMTSILLAEKTPEDAHVLVLGAGGGLELKALADSHPHWTFTGIDPAPEMLRLARQVLGQKMDRVELIEGYIDDAPTMQFDAATCLLTLHFLPEEERRRTIAEIHKRLRPGAPFVAAHGSFPQAEQVRSVWLDRYAAYAVASGADPEIAMKARNAVDASRIMLSPETDEEILRLGGFSDVQQFYSAFTWRGWIGHA